MDTEPSPNPDGAPASQTPLPPLTIKIGGSQPYKSIDNVEWNDIPPFAILTGLNGSGKTQLLELIYYHYLKQTGSPNPPNTGDIKIDIQNHTFAEGDLAYLPANDSKITNAAIGPQSFHYTIQQIKSGGNTDDKKILRARDYITKNTKKQLTYLSDEEIIKSLEDFSISLDEIDIISGLSHVFYNYKINYDDLSGRYISQYETLSGANIKEEIKNKIGTPPWILVNDILKAAEFPYEVSEPENITANYSFNMKDKNNSDKIIRPTDLSSGEQMLLRLSLWLYNYDYASKKFHHPAKILLLDEPDAFLHPSMTRQFLNVINEVLVRKHRIRVIMTTHSPSTVALAPEGSVFVMSRGQPRIQREKSRDHTIGLLTAGLVVVSPATRFVLVEGKDDVAFYEAIREILSEQGPSRDPMAIAPAPSIVFLPASTKTEGGGKRVVEGWVNKLQDPPFNQLFRGIVDGEARKIATDRILAIERHSIENYLCDPLIIYARLNGEGKAPAIEGVNISRGEEYRIRDLGEEDLQKIINKILNDMKSKICRVDDGERQVKFTNGKTLSYPVWFLEKRGHDLLNLCQICFCANLIIPRELISKLHVIRMIPKELAEIMHKIQSLT
ncbi:ATP-binding protein [Acidibrevibacterium fodinaquatile]|uniref:ATP-binding protein n=1 Tax=Acidibrevibacterium fodinaquatile TaxID=1969806 RepID=UPI0013B451DA|nr:AAA family ATPase [Acidibrevibacterium fodinaquatile]